MNEPTPRITFSPFVPLLTLALAVLVLLTWDLTVAAKQHVAGLRLMDQQQQQIVQAAAVENKLRQMMLDLVELAKQNTDAATIATRYGVVFNSQGTPAMGSRGTPQ